MSASLCLHRGAPGNSHLGHGAMTLRVPAAVCCTLGTWAAASRPWPLLAAPDKEIAHLGQILGGRVWANGRTLPTAQGCPGPPLRFIILPWILGPFGSKITGTEAQGFHVSHAQSCCDVLRHWGTATGHACPRPTAKFPSALLPSASCSCLLQPAALPCVSPLVTPARSSQESPVLLFTVFHQF